ncbi:uncharacterized protein [Periplaneta americana]|uniref:uncharacterized protein isoform X4 n=1 Tax=Periplaneta americana TaxID=6978 RepID=UPI0037E89021
MFEMDGGVKNEPESDGDAETQSPRYQPQFVNIKEERMADGDREDEDDDDEDDDEESMTEAVMFPIVKTEYNIADVARNEVKFDAVEAPSVKQEAKDDLPVDDGEYEQEKLEIRLLC